MKRAITDCWKNDLTLKTTAESRFLQQKWKTKPQAEQNCPINSA